VYERFRCSQEFGTKWPRDRYQRIWSALQVQEADRAHIEQGREVREAFERALAEQQDAALQRAAKKRGFSSARVGLGFLLSDVRSAAWPEKQMQSVAVLLGSYDNFKVQQVVGSLALVTNDVFWILLPVKPGRTYEGSTLEALGDQTFQVTGTRTYQSLLGPRQAFVMKPIPELVVEPGAAFAAVQAFATEGHLALAEYADGRPTQCLDLEAKALTSELALRIEVAAETKKPVAALGSCATFTRPPFTRCTLPGGRGSFSTYADSSDHGAAEESSCKGQGGAWQRLADSSASQQPQP